MNEKTVKLTTGAMFTAIYAVLLLLNRQSGGLFQELIMFLVPIPMVGYSSKYGLKSSLPVMASMILISVIVSTPTSVFYSATEAGVGLFLGSGIYAKRSTSRLMLGTMGLSALIDVFDYFVLTALFGYSMFDQVGEMKDMIDNSLVQSGASDEVIQAMDSVLSGGTVIQLMVISAVLLGLIEGFIVFQLSLLILRRLKFYVPKPKSIFLYRPPMWTCIVAVVLYFAYNVLYNRMPNELSRLTIQLLGLCGYLYLVCFGFVAVMLLMRKYVVKNKVVGVIVALLLFMMLPMIEMILGAAYIMPEYHARMINGLFTPEEMQSDKVSEWQSDRRED